VTRVDVAATRCAVLRVVSFSIVALFSLALAACGGSSGVSGASQSVASTAPALPPVSFVQIIGAPPDITNKLTDEVNSAAKERQINVVASEKEADYSVRGYLVAAPDSKGTKLSYIWDVSDKSGKRVRRIQNDEIVDGRKGGDPWSAVDDSALKKIALRTTSELSDWLTKQASSGAGSAKVASSSASTPSPAPTARTIRPASAAQPVSVTPAEATPVTAAMTPVSSQAAAAPVGAAVTYVPPVTGAPGDGQSALADAMKRHLTQQGVKLAEGHSAGAYTVTGSVQMGAAESGEQPITIRWFVKDPSGKSLANAVVQRNKVPAGSLDGSWGQIADLAAGEAARKIAELLPKPSS
jgi:hypothetical protein